MSSISPNDEFKWFIGFVVAVDDPKKLGRVRVRVPSYHDELEDAELPWATPVSPIQSASYYGIGMSPLGLLNGSMVFGFFADGSEARIPLVMGSIAKINFGDEAQHDVNLLAREINFIRKEPIGDSPEPLSPYKAKYPHNKVIQSPSGHIIEIDDTPGEERIHIFHRTGTYIEIDKDGTQVSKVFKDSYDIVNENQKVWIGNNNEVKIKGNCSLTIEGNYDINVQKNINIKASGNINIESEGNFKVTADRIDLN